MEEKYPNTVCLDCLGKARKDTVLECKKKRKGIGSISQYYSVYIVKCDVCGVIKECTEPRDYGYPDFDEQLQRLRLQKIKKIKKIIINLK